ncbi:hypothetical protein HUJ04_011276 [Dendroctonus ponderosae]|nr:hypothetical protein HUJ04_011276 [Dendroctonus ponderosae]
MLPYSINVIVVKGKVCSLECVLKICGPWSCSISVSFDIDVDFSLILSSALRNLGSEFQSAPGISTSSPHFSKRSTPLKDLIDSKQCEKE